MSSFFAFLSRMKLIRRWGLMRNTVSENILEHSAEVAMIAHALAVIDRKMYGGTADPDRVGVLALYHESAEVITGDLPTPVKYYNREISAAYKDIERAWRIAYRGGAARRTQRRFCAARFAGQVVVGIPAGSNTPTNSRPI